MADRAWDKPTAYALLDAASQWRILATQKELLRPGGPSHSGPGMRPLGRRPRPKVI